MKTQVFVIHGGHARNTYEEYIEHLKAKTITLQDLRKIGWKKNLADALGQAYDVYAPQMPNKETARYVEWKIWFEKFLPYFIDNVIFIGHSLGGIFLAKYFSENDFRKKVQATFLVAAPYNTPTEHPRADFNITGPLDRFRGQSSRIFLYHTLNYETQKC